MAAGIDAEEQLVLIRGIGIGKQRGDARCRRTGSELHLDRGCRLTAEWRTVGKQIGVVSAIGVEDQTTRARGNHLQVGRRRATGIAVGRDRVVGELRGIAVGIGHRQGHVLAGSQGDPEQGAGLGTVAIWHHGTAEIALTFDLAAIAIGTGVEVDGVEAEGQRGRVELVTEGAVVGDHGRFQHRPVLQVVRAAVCVVRIVGGRPIGRGARTQVDTVECVRIDSVAANRIGRSAVLHCHAGPVLRIDLAAESNCVSLSDPDATDSRVGCVLQQDAGSADTPVERARRIGADDIALNDRAIGNACNIQFDPGMPRTGDQVVQDLCVVATVRDVDGTTRTTIEIQLRQSVRGDADHVVLDDHVVVGFVAQRHGIDVHAGDDVAVRRRAAADGAATCRLVDEDTVVVVRRRDGCACDIRTDVVTGDNGIRRAGADEHAELVPRDQVPISQCRSPDGHVVAVNADAGVDVRLAIARIRSIAVELPDEVPRDGDVVRPVENIYRVRVEVPNDQAPDFAPVAGGPERQSVETAVIAIDDDGEKAAGHPTRLRGTVDRDRIGDTRQSTRRGDRPVLVAGAADAVGVAVSTIACTDGEGDGVVLTRVGIRIENCLAQRTGTAVVCVGDNEGLRAGRAALSDQEVDVEFMQGARVDAHVVEQAVVVAGGGVLATNRQWRSGGQGTDTRVGCHRVAVAIDEDAQDVATAHCGDLVPVAVGDEVTGFGDRVEVPNAFNVEVQVPCGICVD